MPDALTVELNVPGNIHKRFHVELIKHAGDDPFASQSRDDAQNPPVIDDLGEQEYEIETILRARTVRRGRGRYRQALVKWRGWIDPTWEPVENLRETEALSKFEDVHGSIDSNDGPPQLSKGCFVGPAERLTVERRRSRRNKNKNVSHLH